MQVKVNDKAKLVEVWLTNAEKNDPAIQAKLKPMYASFKEKKYTVAVFLSGTKELYPSVRDLLAYNKLKSAQLAVQREKTPKQASLAR